MQEMVLYLTENLEALESVKNGQSSLLGVSVEEQRAILKSFEGNQEKLYYWA
ncbi:competence pheromone ComX [Ectobacillus funiculus]|uniref:ComX pheromone n=1 Tax=Ectobacillus funiculus TaxID=137993 RepID=A0ABV5WIA2_9BACI